MKRMVMEADGVPDENTLLLLHFNGDVRDSSIYNRLITNNGCLFDKDNAKFGSSVYRKSYSEKILPPANLLDEVVKYPNFTIDCWLYYTYGSMHMICKTYSGQTDSVGFEVEDGYLWFGNYGYDNNFSNIVTNERLPFNKWIHVAVVVIGNKINLHVDGKIVKTGTIYNRNLPSYPTTIMGRSSNRSDDISPNSRMDELRISNIARWTSDFTPPTKQY